jgi:hypothetical protein
MSNTLPFNNNNNNNDNQGLNQPLPPHLIPNFHNNHNITPQSALNSSNTLMPPSLMPPQLQQQHQMNNQQFFMPPSSTLGPQSQNFYNNNNNNNNNNTNSQAFFNNTNTNNNSNSLNPGNFMHKNNYDELAELNFSHSFIQPHSLNQFNNNMFNNGNQYQQFNNQPSAALMTAQPSIHHHQQGATHLSRAQQPLMSEPFKNHGFANDQQQAPLLPFQSLIMSGNNNNNNSTSSNVIHASSFSNMPPPPMSQRNMNNPIGNLPLQNQHIVQPLKPSSIYINPSFVPKQQQQPQQQQNQIENANPIQKQNRRKDLELLLEKRLAAELLASESSSSSSPSQPQKSTSKGPTKRKSNELSITNSNSSPTTTSKSLSLPLNSTKKQQISPVKRDQTPDAQPPTKKVMPSSSPVKSKIKSVVTPVVVVAPALAAPIQTTKTPSSVIVIDDPEYSRKLEEQKRKREEMLRLKEEKRNQRILEASNKTLSTPSTKPINNEDKSSSNTLVPLQNKPTRTVIATNEIIIPNITVANATNGQKVNRIVTKTNTPIQLSSSVKYQESNETLLSAKRLIIQNLSLNTTDKNIISMCNSINLKDKVKTKTFFINS